VTGQPDLVGEGFGDTNRQAVAPLLDLAAHRRLRMDRTTFALCLQ
jgi:hypothetical protein